MKEVVCMEHVRTSFGSKVIHEDVNLTIRPGEIYAIIGGSGSGKTTLVREMIMLMRPSGGSIKVLGHDVLNLSARQAQHLRTRWGVLFQFGALYTSLNIAQNIAVALQEYTALPGGLIDKIVRTKLMLVGLDPDVGTLYPSELSGGMVKRAALARALAMDPKLIFLDEPTSGLDPLSAESFDRLIVSLRDLLGITFVMITHDIDSIFNVVDRMAVIGDKRVVVEGSIEEVIACSHPFIQEFFGGNRAQCRRKERQRHGA